MPKDELWQLYRAAYEQYQSEFLNGDFTYHRFVERFYSYQLPAFCLNEEEFRLHVMHVNELKDLLENRTDLVEIYFSKNSFKKKDYIQMDRDFNTRDYIIKEPLLLASFNSEQISLITRFANEAELFSDNVSEYDIAHLFSCSLVKPLKAKVNRHIAKFFDSLRNGGFLPYAWQKLIADKRLIASSATGKPLTAHMIGSYLSEYKQGKDTLDSQCRKLILKLKESM